MKTEKSKKYKVDEESSVKNYKKFENDENDDEYEDDVYYEDDEEDEEDEEDIDSITLLKRIAENTKKTAFWIRFWSILSLISGIIILIYLFISFLVSH